MAEKTPVAPMDPGKQNSPKAGPSEGETTVMLDSAAKKCVWNGQEFDDGDLVECDGEVWECTYGRWSKMD